MNIEVVRQVAQILHGRNVLEANRNHHRKRQHYFDNIMRARKQLSHQKKACQSDSDVTFRTPILSHNIPHKWLKTPMSELRIYAKTAQVEYEKAKLEMMLYTKKTHKQLCKLLKGSHIHLTSDWGGGYRSMYTHTGGDGYQTVARDKKQIAYIAWEATAEEMLLCGDDQQT